MSEFVIPGSLEEMSSSSAGTYMMIQPWDERKIARAQEEWQSKAVVLDDAPKLVPIFYSAITQTPNLSEFMLTDLWRLIFKFVNKLESALNKLSKDNALGPEERKCLRNETTIVTYFFGQYIQAIDLETRKVGAAFDVMAKKTKKKGPAGVGRFANWDTERITALEAILQILEAPLKSIFSDDSLNQLVNSVASNIYRLLGNISVCKDSTCSDLCAQIINIAIMQYGHGSLCPYQIPALMSTTEHVVPVLASIFDEVVNKHGEISLLPDLLRELTAISDCSNGDSLVSKNTGELLNQLCQKLAERILPLVSYIDALLNAPNFSVRNSALSAMAELVKHGLTKPGLTEKQEKDKDSLLDMLIAHMNDVSSHVRGKCIKLLSELLLANSLPLARQPEVITAVAKRLRDSTATVRKYAVQYLTEYVEYNTFLRTMTPESLETALEQKRALVAELKEQIGVDQKTPDDWDEVSAKMMSYFGKKELPKLPDDPNDLERPKGTLQEELGNVTSLLDAGKFSEAIRLLQKCAHWFQECPLFREVEAEEEGKETASDESETEKNETESEGEGDEDEQDSSKSEKTEQESEKKVKVDWFALARNVYLREPPRKTAKNQRLDEHDELTPSQAEPDEATSQTDREILISKLAKHESDLRVVSYLRHYFDVYSAASQHVGMMLQSKITSDILSAIDFFVRLINANVSVGCRSISQMAHLYDHKDESVKKAVESAFENLYLTCDTNDPRKNSIVTARKLIGLFINCTQGEVDKWGRVIAQLVADKKIPSEVVLVFFEIITEKLGKEEPLVRTAALLLIAKCSTRKPSIVEKNMPILLELMKEPIFIKYSIMALSNLDVERRWDIEHECFVTITNAFVENLSNMEWTGWSSAFFEAVCLIFKSCAKPMKTLTKLANSVLQAWTDRQDLMQFARVLSMVQSIAARLYVFLDIDFYGKLQEKKDKSKKTKEQRRKSLSESRRNANASMNATNDGDQTGLVGAVADETEAEYIVTILENEALKENCFLGSFTPHLINVLKNPKDFPCPKLQQQATVSLISLMLISSRLYEEHIAFIFTILERSLDELQRCAIITYIPDLCKSFPNSFDPWTAKVYEVLKRESSANVRRKCILILSDLIMHDQIKVKGTISDVACSLLDEHAPIVRMTEILFQQLAMKNNSLYNILPDIISRLSDEEHGVKRDDFQKIISFLFKQLGKDKKLENFVEKLCGRFRSSTTDLQCRNLAYCLKQIPYTERSLRKLIDNISCYADKLIDPEIAACFDEICQQTSKGAKNELKLVVTELENALDEAKNKSDENKEINSDDPAAVRRTPSSQRSTVSSQKSATARARRTAKTPKTPQRKKKITDLMDSDSDGDDFIPASSSTRSAKRIASGATTPTTVRTSKRTRL
ncbi:condensin complex subunit 1 [Galendromus occidentalis]|uniref:Condensin complex subunit 1 n=1 Tax=Galendromus occidentalis TaxID=34638 RepID=A0AAJ6QX39_9ACAR|nr:condensin complex subunit 1 [Galendromus occidentalis]